jgi:hypothetical protein
MTTHPHNQTNNPYNVCTWRDAAECQGCPVNDRLKCRFRWGHAAWFSGHFIPIAIVALVGMIRGGYGIYLLGWLGFMLFFFNVWETHILCRHCPYYAERGSTLHCIANYSSLKLWAYNPKPMSRSEQIQFLIGAIIIVGYPFPFLILGEQYLLALIGTVAVVVPVWSLLRTTCARCVNFSCPLNRVPKPVIDAFLDRNPVMREAWIKAGWRIMR